MANLGYIMSGAGPLIKKYRVGAGTPDFTVAGAPAVVAATTAAGVLPQAAATVGINLGLSLDTAVYTTTQSPSMIEGQITLVINPDAVYRLRMSGGATAGTALPLITNSAASAGGTVVTITTGDIVPNSPTMLDGTLICLSGSNVGLRRRVTTVGATSLTVLVPFPFAIASGDTFTVVPYFPGGVTATGINGDNLTLTTTPGTLATEAQAAAASSTAGVRYGHVDIQYDVNDQNRGRDTGFLYASPTIHLYKQVA
jgi:hypothetical protein